MKKLYLLVLGILTPLIASSQVASNPQSNKNIILEQILANQYNHSLISRGDNFPDFYPETDSISEFLVALHYNIDISEFIAKSKYSQSGIEKLSEILISKNWLHRKDGKLKPTIFIASKEDGAKLYKESLLVSKDIVNEIAKIAPSIEEKFNEMELSKNATFDKWSFLILSNVLLDSWMIDYVEKDYLKQEQRPIRNGKNYYYSIMEVTTDVGVFGIYGNQYKMEDGLSISVYGNNRIDVPKEKIKNFISKSDNNKLNEMVEHFRPILLSVLQKYDFQFKNVYKTLGYSDEISYEEFFIWFYHFIYTKATNIMSEKGLIQIPPSGNFYYIIEE